MKKLIAIWGIIGIVAVVGRALWRLTPIAIEPIQANQLGTFHWLVMIAWILINAYAEGYRGFHKRYSPRTVARAFYLVDNPTPLRVIFAPLFCMGLFGATRRVLISSYVVIVLVICLIIWIRMIDQPWRGIVDAGVVVGLGLGLMSIIGYFIVGLKNGGVPFDPCVPVPDEQS